MTPHSLLIRLTCPCGHHISAQSASAVSAATRDHADLCRWRNQDEAALATMSQLARRILGVVP